MKNLTLFEKFKIPNYFSEKNVTTGIVEIDGKDCTGCGICALICPGRALEMIGRGAGIKKKIPYLYEDAPGVNRCMACGDCAAACPQNAITIKRGYNTKYFYRKITQVKEFALPRKY